jgi:hypothetical protein
MPEETINTVLACLARLRQAENQYRESMYDVHSKLMDIAVLMDETQFRLLLEYLRIPSKIKLDVWRVVKSDDFKRVRLAKRPPMEVKKAV